MPLETAGEWLGSGHDVTNLGVIVEDSAAVSRLVDGLQEALAEPIGSGTIIVMGWREAMPQLSAAVAIDDFGNYLVYGILFTIIGFGIVNTVLMSVMHRYREFGGAPGARASTGADRSLGTGRGTGADGRQRRHRHHARDLLDLVLLR